MISFQDSNILPKWNILLQHQYTLPKINILNQLQLNSYKMKVHLHSHVATGGDITEASEFPGR